MSLCGYTTISLTFKNDNELGLTILPMMNTADYKERFRAEYFQLKIRLSKLRDLLDKDANGELDFTLSCPRSLLVNQLSAMREYRKYLEKRASYEGIDLSVEYV